MLENISSPKDVKCLNNNDLNILCSEIRNTLINRVSKTGGHFGPNLGVVELTTALHYVFNSPNDKMVYDTSHQTYVHKMLTGRKDAFINEENYLDVTGFSTQHESEHDFFILGHTSTSISLAYGLAKSRDMKNDSENVIAIIGDGSLSGGQAFEALSVGGKLDSNFIVIVNDNDISIGDNYGSIYDNLRLLRESNGEYHNNFFESLGYEYTYVEEGNNVLELIEVFKSIKDRKCPMVIHVNTVKGLGYLDSEINKEKYHYISPFNLETNELNFKPTENYVSITNDYLCEKVSKNKNIIGITPGTPGLFSKFRNEHPNNFLDVGIAEQTAVSIASSMASNGIRPVVSLFSSFSQRAYDQFSQDLAINNNPSITLIFNNGINKSAETHLGVFDISLLSNIPNIVFMCPTSKEEYLSMLDFSINQTKYPIIIRIPRILFNEECTDTNFEINKFKKTIEGEKICVIGLGAFYKLAKEVVDKLKEENINASLINPRFASGIDEIMLRELEENHDLVITLEDGILDGGFGEKITRFYGDKNMKVLNFGATKEFVDNVSLDELYEKYNLKEDLIVKKIKESLNN